MTLVQPEMTLVQPEMTLVQPEMTLVQPEMTLVQPEMTLVQPEMTLVQPEMTLVQPEMTLVQPEMTLVQPEMTLVQPEVVTTNSESFMSKLKRFQSMPCYKQKSQQWLAQRNNYLTASTIAAAIGVLGVVARNNLLLNKVSNGLCNGFNGNVATHWGNKYEPVANGIYSYRNNVEIYDFGMITNDKYPILGISPDGITETAMLEIKCPWSRVIDGKIKTEYYHQMQEQMAVCEFDKCDFLECRFEEITEKCFWDDFYYYDEQENNNREKGIIISYINISEGDSEYLYSPIECYQNLDKMKEWEKFTIENLLRNKNTIYLNESYWYLIKYNCQIVNRDPYWISEYYPVLQKFWEEVEYYRKIGVDKLMEKIKPHKNDNDSPKISEYLTKSSVRAISAKTKSKKKSKCLL